ncbi:hypothetical protein PJO48_29585, partial [Mycobacterium kansasii]
PARSELGTGGGSTQSASGFCTPDPKWDSTQAFKKILLKINILKIFINILNNICWYLKINFTIPLRKFENAEIIKIS